VRSEFFSERAASFEENVSSKQRFKSIAGAEIRLEGSVEIPVRVKLLSFGQFKRK